MTKLIVWCPATGSPAVGAPVAYWSQFGPLEPEPVDQAGRHVFLPAIVNGEAERWKREYLGWLDEMAGLESDPESRVSRLLVEEGLSGWWMGLPTEFSFSPVSSGYTCMRLWALMDVIAARSVAAIHVVGAPEGVERVLKGWCLSTNRTFTSEPAQVPAELPPSIPMRGRAFRRMPPVVIGLLTIARLYWWYSGSRRTATAAGPMDAAAGSLVIVDYFAHLDVEAARRGDFQSSYWTDLVDVIEALPDHVTWVHIDLSEGDRRQVAKNRQAVQAMNAAVPKVRHHLLQDGLRLPVALRAVRLFLRLQRAQRVAFEGGDWLHARSGADMTPVVSAHWCGQLTGQGGARNAVWVALMDDLVRRSPRPSRGLYLMEGQAWELALLRAWHIGRLGPLVGVVPSVAHPSDLRYAVGSPSRMAERATLPEPDLVATTGTGSRDVLLKNGVPAHRVVGVEALRFAGGVTGTPPIRDGDSQFLLCLGEYDSDLRMRQLEILAEAAVLLGDDAQVVFRHHPAGGSAPDLPAGVTASTGVSVATDLDCADLVFTTNSTSASLDAYLSGRPLCMFRDGRILDRSPLPSSAGVTYVDSAAGLAAWVRATAADRVSSVDVSEVLTLDSTLPRWTALLGSEAP